MSDALPFYRLAQMLLEEFITDTTLSSDPKITADAPGRDRLARLDVRMMLQNARRMVSSVYRSLFLTSAEMC